jgi:hypothetical protein
MAKERLGICQPVSSHVSSRTHGEYAYVHAGSCMTGFLFDLSDALFRLLN